MTIFTDSNHSHNKITRKSIIGLVELLRSTSMNWYAKWQLEVMISTLRAEFRSLKRAVEEVVIYQYYYQSFRIHVTKPITIYEDNISVVLSSSNLDSIL